MTKWTDRAKSWLEFCLDPFEEFDGRNWKKISAGLLGSFLFLLLVSSVLLTFGDKINAKGTVVTRFMARSQAPLAAHFYPTAAREQISVLLYDPEFFRVSASAWPISYGEHAEWLLRITGEPNARPKAVMLDVTFGQERDDPSLPQLQDALCAIQNKYGIPVFLAAVASPLDGRLHLRKGLFPIDRNSGEHCFTAVDVSYSPDPLDGLAWTYAVRRYLGSDGWVNGSSPEGDKPSLDSAALAIARDAAQIDLGEDAEPLALMWGLRTPDLSDRPELLHYCKPGQINWYRLVPGIVRNLFSEKSVTPICPYHTTVSMSKVGAMADDELSALLAGRFVFIGAFVPGYNDFVNSPIHGLVPGVYLHAMALDNLLSYGAEYKVATDWSETQRSPDLWKSALLAVFAIIFVRFIWTLLRNWLAKRPSIKRLQAKLPGRKWYRDQRTVAARLFKLIVDAALWLTKLSVQAAAALLLVALLQWQLRIGMLPVTELVAMALVAEGLHIMKRIRAFLAGDTAKAGDRHAD